MRNVHTRDFVVTVDHVKPWIDAAWSGTPRDPFPRDILRSWRRNPPGEDPQALLPGVTLVGHGPFSFRFESWDGARWRVRLDTDDFRGWHGFDLAPTSSGCRLTHTIELELAGKGRLVWPVFIAPVHDWCVEAILDRIEVAAVRC